MNWCRYQQNCELQPLTSHALGKSIESSPCCKSVWMCVRLHLSDCKYHNIPINPENKKFRVNWDSWVWWYEYLKIHIFWIDSIYFFSVSRFSPVLLLTFGELCCMHVAVQSTYCLICWSCNEASNNRCSQRIGDAKTIQRMYMNFKMMKVIVFSLNDFRQLTNSLINCGPYK